MIVTRSGLRSIGWAMILTVCLALTVALTFKVNAVKSQVRLTERQIVAVEQDRNLLETEFETRASQRQLTSLNTIELGLKAPKPGQYLEGERQLASLGKPRGLDAPAPIMVASADRTSRSGFPAMVNPLSGKAEAAERPAGGQSIAQAKRQTGSELGSRLSRVDHVASSAKGATAE